MTPLPDDSVHPLELAQWHQWFQEHHQNSSGVWLVSYRSAETGPRIPYEQAVEEALCWGWIDSSKRVWDEQRSLLRFTPRRRGSPWARTNKERVARLEAEGRLQPSGRAAIEKALRDGSWTILDGPEAGVVPEELALALAALEGASDHFRGFPPSERKQILTWIALAKTPETRTRRIAEAAARSGENRRIGTWNAKETP